MGVINDCSVLYLTDCELSLVSKTKQLSRTLWCFFWHFCLFDGGRGILFTALLITLTCCVSLWKEVLGSSLFCSLLLNSISAVASFLYVVSADIPINELGVLNMAVVSMLYRAF